MRPTKMMKLSAPNVGGGNQKNAKAAYVAARRKRFKCDGACLRSKMEHCARMKAQGKADPSKGFRHLATCPLKRAADAERR